MKLPTLKKRKEQRKEIQAKNRPFRVLIGVPVPKIDHKINSKLGIFLSECCLRRIGMPYLMPSMLAEYARNNIIRDFLEKEMFAGMTHLLFMDHDTAPVDPDMLVRLLAYEKDVVAGVTPILLTNTDPPSLQWNVQGKDQKNMELNTLSGELFQAEKVGGTSILIARHVLEALPRPYQESIMDDNHENFKTGEDYYFCNQIRQAGFDIWIDPTQMCHHFHTIDILSIVEMMAGIKQENEDPACVEMDEEKDRLLKALWKRLCEDYNPASCTDGDEQQALLADLKRIVEKVA
jgi:hypothetical protein